MIVVPALDDIKGVRGEERDILVDGGAQGAQMVQEGDEGVAAGLQDPEQFGCNRLPVGLVE